MKIPLGWLSMYANIGPILAEKGIQQFSEDYSIYTAEVEEMEEVGKNDLIVVGRVLEAIKHPEADKLNVTKVDTGSHGIFQIVCGAANVVDATYVGVALEGCEVAPDFIIGKRDLRGIESCGMICSADELGLQGDRGEGILRLETLLSESVLERNLGKPLHTLSFPFLAMDDTLHDYPILDVVMDLDNKFITNRPDLFGVYGNARECATIYDLPLTEWIGALGFGSQTLTCKVDTDGCTNYTLTKYEHVSPIASPQVIKTLLYRCGLGTKNALVDLTNLISTELAQPLHCFDADKIQGDIQVRDAKDGETFEALDDVTYTLHAGDVVIADDSGVIALAGVIGGKGSAVTESTQNIIVEAATFDAVRVRKTASHHAIRTDASMRFEKSQDPHNPERAQARFAQLLRFCQLPHTPSAMYQYKENVDIVTIQTTMETIERKIGMPLDRNKAIKNLEKLGFALDQSEESLTLEVPSWRATKDVTIAEDIIEEVARLQNYNTLPTPPLSDRVNTVVIDPTIRLEMQMSDYFTSQGLYDAYTYTFTSQERNAYFQEKKDQIEVTHSYSEEHAVMRRSLYDSLLILVQDHHREYGRFGFFESGSVFGKDIQNHQKRVSLGITYGYSVQQVADMLGGLIETGAHVQDYRIQQSCPENLRHVMHPNKTGTFVVDGKEVIAYGYLHPVCASRYELKATKVIVFCILDRAFFLDQVARYTPLAKFPGIDREINLVMDSQTPAGNICEQIASVHTYITAVGVKEVYEDKVKIGDGKKSVLFQYELRNPQATMTDEEALAIQEAIITKMASQGILLRA